LLYLAWKHGGHDPYRLYNGLDDDYRPIEDSEKPVMPPPDPRKLRNVIYGFATFAHQETVEHVTVAAGGTVERRGGI
jgi:hypothetical protein